jgi:hypothetical protein
VSGDEKVPAQPAAVAPAAPPKPAPAPPKVEAPSLTPAEMITAELLTFLEERLKSGEPVTVDVNKQTFTGRLFRLMLHEGWIALEHVDGRRRAFYVIEGGKLRSRAGVEVSLPGGHGK